MKLRDVADLAGVSPATASQVFSGNRPVAARTRQRVLAAASTLGYKPKEATRVIGVLVRPPEAITSFTTGTTSFSTITGAVSLSLLHAGFTAFVCGSFDELLANSALLDGSVVLHPNFEDQAITELESHNIPVVALDRDPAATSYPWWVGVNYYASFIRLIQHMQEAGSKKIGLLIGETDNVYRRSILQAYSTLSESSGQRQLIRVLPNDGGAAAAQKMTNLLFSAAPDCDAILTSSSVFASGALAACTERRLQVPSDVKIASVLDGSLAEKAPCPITSMRLDTTLIASQVVDLLERRLAKQAAPQVHQTVLLDLVPRRSTQAMDAG
ncbi:LacI family DNA-binding transcriptional regulator [Gulosibacter sediminis]|uniref:LacI family DNA-binding transcriptional regulator n=1 Tax=Gulosibacter sediminis TaxID=1729695 RepID=UPI0024AD0A72|nr:LacI family DNA-binding transcriptional regulator [Gulosibacter sediminis]